MDRTSIGFIEILFIGYCLYTQFSQMKYDATIILYIYIMQKLFGQIFKPICSHKPRIVRELIIIKSRGHIQPFMCRAFFMPRLSVLCIKIKPTWILLKTLFKYVRLCLNVIETSDSRPAIWEGPICRKTHPNLILLAIRISRSEG